MSIVLFAFPRILAKQREIMVWKYETRHQATLRFTKQIKIVQEAAPYLTNGISNVRWGWVEIDKRLVTLCLVDYEPALGPLVLHENSPFLSQHYIIHLPGKDCDRDDHTFHITTSMENTIYLTQACMTLMKHPPLTSDFDADTRIPVGWEEPHPIDLLAYERIGLPIINIDNVVPPGRRPTSYHIPAPIGTLIGEVPAIAIDLLDQQQVRYAYRSTTLLRLHYGAVKLVACKPLPENWRGQAGQDNVRHLLKTRFDRINKPPDNLSTQHLSSIVGLKTKAVPELFPKRCQDNRFQGVTILSSVQEPSLVEDFTYASVWDQESPTFSKTTDHFAPNNFPFLSEPSLKALAFLPAPVKQSQKHQVRACYLAGVGSDDHNLTVLERMEHPYAGVLSSLPQTLFIAAMLQQYSNDPSLYKGSIHEHFDTIYDAVIENSPGIVDPWAYFGTRGSFFPFHQEDALLPSANLMVLGNPKVWIFVTESGMDLLRVRMAEYLQPCYMLHRSIFFHPEFLAGSNIPFTIAVQCEGELILADARSGHQGWNMGPNLAEAVNYADLAAMEYQRVELYRDGMAVWPCVCGAKPVPTNPHQKQDETTLQSLYLYRPEWAPPEGLGCSALYQWVETLLKHVEGAPGPVISPMQLIELRDYVYKKVTEKRALRE